MPCCRWRCCSPRAAPDPYDTGEGSLSQMRADFVEAHTDANACMTSVETDGGERLTLTPPVALEWAAKPDTTYRALLYYNKTADANGTLTAEPIAMQQVLVPQIVTAEDIEGGMKTDPVEFISAWKSVNGKYLNLEFAVKTGTNDGTYNAQTIGVTCDGVDRKRRRHTTHKPHPVPRPRRRA